MTERAICIGPGRSLVGILSEPDETPDPERPAIIMLNAGLIHRVGPNRLHVRLARRLADQGFLALRLDLSGRGDSEPRRDGLSFEASGTLEAADAMRHLEATKGTRRFVLFGICSGASTAAQIAHGDERVAGAVIVEGTAFPTRRFYVRYYTTRLFSRATWWNVLTGTNAAGRRIRQMLGRPSPAPDANQMMDGVPAPELPRAVAAAALRQMVERRVELLAVFSGSTKAYNYEGQLRAAFSDVDFQGRLEEAYYPAADHTFTRISTQDVLVARILDWMATKFPATLRSQASAPLPDARLSTPVSRRTT